MDHGKRMVTSQQESGRRIGCKALAAALILMAGFTFRIPVAGAAAPLPRRNLQRDLAEWDKGETEARVRLLGEWCKVIDAIWKKEWSEYNNRDRKRKGSKPVLNPDMRRQTVEPNVLAKQVFGETWMKIIEKVAEVPAADSALARKAVSFFCALNLRLPGALNLCHGMLKVDSAADDTPADGALFALVAMKARDTQTARLLLARASSLRTVYFSKKALKYLAETFGDLPEVKERFFELAKTKELDWYLFALDKLPRLKLDRKEAQRCVSLWLDLLSSKNLQKHRSLREAAELPSLYSCKQTLRSCLDDKSVESLFPLMQSDVASRSQLASWLYVLGCPNHTPARTRKVFDILCASKDAKTRERIAGLAFLPVEALSEIKLEELLERARTAGPVERAGMLSMYLRKGGDRSRGRPTLKGKPAHEWYPHEKYWTELTGCVAREVHSPETWRKKWPPVPSKVQAELVQSVEAFPNAKEVPWLLDQAIRSQLSYEILLDTLWRIRFSGVDLKRAFGLRRHLGQLAWRGQDLNASIRSACLLYHFFGDRRSLQTVESRLKRKVWNVSNYYAKFMEVDPKHPVVDEGLRLLETEPRARQVEFGVDWIRWRLRTIRGEVEKPSVIDLATALNPGYREEHLTWMESKPEIIKPFLSVFRDPYVWIAARTYKPDYALRFLGFLDRLELKWSKDDAKKSAK